MIRLRIVLPYLVIASIALALRGALVEHQGELSSRELARRATVYQDGMKRRKASPLLENDWTEFQLNQTARRVRVLTNALIPKTTATHEADVERPLEDPRRGWRYGLDYELLDESKSTIERSTYHFRSQVEVWEDPETGEFRFPIELDTPDIAVAQTKVMQFATDANSQPAYLRLRTGAHDASVRGVLVRVFDQVERPEYDKTKTWVRMSKGQRERLCSNSVFTSELLSIDERQNLLRLMWVPAVKLNRFDVETMYFLDRSSGEAVMTDRPILSGTRIDADRWISIEIPDYPGRLSVLSERSHRFDDPAQFSPSEVIADYQGGDPRQGLSKRVAFRQGETIGLPTHGGLLVLRCQSETFVSTHWSPLQPASSGMAPASEQSIELSPVTRRSRSFLVDNEPLEFDLYSVLDQNVAEQLAPIRLVLRMPLDPMFAAEDSGLRRQSDGGAVVTCEMLDEGGSILRSMNFSCVGIRSPLDDLEVLGKRTAVSKPTIRYFAADNAVARIRLTTSGRRVLATLYNRPPGMPHFSKVANPPPLPKDDSFEVVSSEHGRVPPDWFPLRPRNYDDLVSKNRSFLIRSHPRPIERDESILEGRYQWYRFEPSGTWIGKEAMVSLDEDAALDEFGAGDEFGKRDGSRKVVRSASSIYCRLEPNQDYRFSTTRSDAFFDAPAPRMYVVSDRSIGDVRIFVDDQLWDKRYLASRRSEFELEDSLPLNGAIRIECRGDASLFLRGRAVDHAKRFRRRTLQSLAAPIVDWRDAGRSRVDRKFTPSRAGDKSLTFRYDKLTDDEELVSVKFFLPWSEGITSRTPSRIRISILDALENALVLGRPQKDWTIRTRSYEIEPPDLSESLVLGSGQPLRKPATCFVRLKSDLPKGRYRIVVEPIENASDGFVLVSQTLAAEPPKRRLHRD